MQFIPSSKSTTFPREGSFGSDSDYLPDQGQANRPRSISQTSLSSYDSTAAGYQPHPADVSCMSNFDCWKVLKFIAGASIAAFGIVVAASGGAAFGAGVFISAPIGACICAAGLGMMGITVHTHFTDKKIAESEKNTRLIIADMSASNYREIAQLKDNQRLIQLELEGQIKDVNGRIDFLISRAADKFVMTKNLNEMQEQLDAINEQVDRLQNQEPTSSSIMLSPGTTTSGHSSPIGPLPTGTTAWTSTQSHLSPLPISELHPPSTTSSPATEAVPTAPYPDPATTDDAEPHDTTLP